MTLRSKLRSIQKLISKNAISLTITLLKRSNQLMSEKKNEYN